MEIHRGFCPFVANVNLVCEYFKGRCVTIKPIIHRTGFAIYSMFYPTIINIIKVAISMVKFFPKKKWMRCDWGREVFLIFSSNFKLVLLSSNILDLLYFRTTQSVDHVTSHLCKCFWIFFYVHPVYLFKVFTELVNEFQNSLGFAFG